MDKHGIKINASDIEIFDQGSYKISTTIKSKSIDRDIAVILPLDIATYADTRKIKGYVRDALNRNRRTITIKEPCINISYIENEEEWMHIDLPIYAKCNGLVYLARGRENATEGNYSWEPADPRKLNDWFIERLNGQQQLRRCIRYLKKWKQEKYANSTLDHEIPPSIGITFLVMDHFVACTTQEGDDDLLALQKTVQNIMSTFSLTYNESGELIKAITSRLLPVTPFTDVFKKMNDSSITYGVTFYQRLEKASRNLTDACNASSEYDAGCYVRKVFGDDFSVPVKQAEKAFAESRREPNFG